MSWLAIVFAVTALSKSDWPAAVRWRGAQMRLERKHLSSAAKRLARHFYRPTRSNEFPWKFHGDTTPWPRFRLLLESGQRCSQHIDAATGGLGGTPHRILARWLTAGLRSA